MYYFILIYEFFKTSEKKPLLVNTIIPLCVGILVYVFYVVINTETEISAEMQSDILSVVGVLLGFSFSVFTIFLTAEGNNIDKAKKYILKGITLHDEVVSLYKALTICFTYIVVLEGFLLILCFLYPIFFTYSSNAAKFFFSVSVFTLTHCILMTMRLILNFYFIITKKENEDDTIE